MEAIPSASRCAKNRSHHAPAAWASASNVGRCFTPFGFGAVATAPLAQSFSVMAAACSSARSRAFRAFNTGGYVEQRPRSVAGAAPHYVVPERLALQLRTERLIRFSFGLAGGFDCRRKAGTRRKALRIGSGAQQQGSWRLALRCLRVDDHVAQQQRLQHVLARDARARWKLGHPGACGAVVV